MSACKKRYTAVIPLLNRMDTILSKTSVSKMHSLTFMLFLLASGATLAYLSLYLPVLLTVLDSRNQIGHSEVLTSAGTGTSIIKRPRQKTVPVNSGDCISSSH